MKTIGMVRDTDNLGRIVLPKELRKTFDINFNDGLEIFVDEDKIILRKYDPACVFCGEARGTSPFKGKMICEDCLKGIK